MQRVRAGLGAFVAVVIWLVVTAQAASALTAPPVPAAIKVPAGNIPFLVGHAIGFQIYACTATSSGFAWTLSAPRAVLYDDAGKPIVVHYAGPTWRANDASTVVGARVASAPAPSTTAIPWLLLKAASTQPGPGGGTQLAVTTYIQRINTAGGVAPATGCDAAHQGAVSPVRYTADYWFFRAG